MIVTAALSYIESTQDKQLNPYTQPNVEIAKSEFYKHNIVNQIGNISNANITISTAKYVSFLFFCEDKKEMNVQIREIIKHMNIKNTPFFIDVAPSYLHTTGELHKKHIKNVNHYLIYDNKELEKNINLNQILNRHLHSEISIFRQNYSNFSVIHLDEIIKHLKLL